MANDPQVPWTDEQWARVNQAVQEEAKRSRVAATFLPLYGPLDPDADFIRKQEILYSVPQDAHDAALAERDAAKQLFEEAARVLRGGGAVQDLAAAFAAQERIAKAQAILTRRRLGIDDRDTIRLATLQVIVPVRNAQMADPELTSVLALFRRAANVVARLEDAVVFRGLAPDPGNPGGYAPPPQANSRSSGHLANHRRALGARNLDARSADIHSGNADRRKRSAARKRNIQGHWSTGAEWAVRSVRRGSWSRTVSCGADPGQEFACAAAGPHHPVPRRWPAAPVFNV